MVNFNHINIETLNFDLKSKTTENGRVYLTPSGNIYPSVTTVLSTLNKKAILEWRKRVGMEVANIISKQATRKGNTFHNVCEKFLKNVLTENCIRDMMPTIKQLFISVKPFLQEHLSDIQAIENCLYSDRLRIAGRVDCIAKWDRRLSIIDFKTSLKPKKEEWIENYFMQCTLYSCMYQELTGTPINQIVVIIAVEDKKVPQIFVKSKLEYLEKSINHVKKYHQGLL